MNWHQKELIKWYPLMNCGNNLEFKQRLGWLSEGMLENHLVYNSTVTINQNEIELYRKYCMLRSLDTGK